MWDGRRTSRLSTKKGTTTLRREYRRCGEVSHLPSMTSNKITTTREGLWKGPTLSCLTGHSLLRINRCHSWITSQGTNEHYRQLAGSLMHLPLMLVTNPYSKTIRQWLAMLTFTAISQRCKRLSMLTTTCRNNRLTIWILHLGSGSNSSSSSSICKRTDWER